MPVPNGLQKCISDSLSKSLASKGKAGDKDVSNAVTSSAKRALLEKATIKFVKAEKDANSMLQNLKDKYVCLNPGSSSSSDKQNGHVSTKTDNGVKHKSDGLPTPKMVLYDPDKVKLTWETPRKVGSGLANLGNTCFLNSVLQCLSYTAPLAGYLLSGQHKSQCRCHGFCMLCELQSHFNRCLTQHGGALKPLGVLQKLKMIAKHMRWGRQEDAHEFLRYVVDAMQKACLSGHSSSLEKLSKETTLVHQVFGGYLRSQVRCMQCKTTSDTYDPVLDISVDIKGVNSVEKALQKFVQPETLDVDNAYKCLRCKKKVRAFKQFTIHRAPKVLTIHLKRFDYHRLMGGKVGRHIDFSNHLNLRPFMSQRQGEAVNYQLYAVLVHSGFSCNSGHYYCYIKSPNQTWYCMNDSHVSQTGVSNVLSSEAYILFYSQLSSNRSTTQGSAAQKIAQSMNGSPHTVRSPFADKAQKAQKHSQSSQSQVDKPAVKSPLVQPSLISTPAKDQNKISTPVNVHPPHKRTDSVTNSQTVPRRISLTTIQGAPDVQTPKQTGSSSSEEKPTPKLATTSTGKHKRSHDEKTETESAKSSPLKKLKKKNERSELVNGDSNVALSKLMSPPRTPSITSPTNKVATSNWLVTPTNGHLHSHSESETGSVNSTSSWTVSATTKFNTASSNSPSSTLLNGVRKKKKKKVAQDSTGLSNGDLKRKVYCPPTESSYKMAESFAPPKKKRKKKLKNDLQLSNETTPEPPLSQKKKKKKKKKADVLHSKGGSQSLETATESVAKQLTNNSTKAASPVVRKTAESVLSGNDKTMVKKTKKKATQLKGEESTDPQAAGDGVHCNTTSLDNVVSQTSGALPNKENCKRFSVNGVVNGVKNCGEKNGKVNAENEVERRKEKKRRFSEPAVKVWNASVDEEDVAFKRQGNANSLSVWDGRKESNISFLMERHASSVKGLGSGVSTWDGGKPEINREVEKEKLTAGYKNSWYDGYEQEIDEGRKKKVKVKKHIDKDNRDHFQWIQNSTNKVRELKREGKLPSLPSYNY